MSFQDFICPASLYIIYFADGASPSQPSCQSLQSGPSCSKHRLLNELVKGHFVNCCSRFNIQYSDIFC